MTLAEHLIDIGACDEAQEWVGTRTAAEAWRDCDEPLWLIWWLLNARPETLPEVVVFTVGELRTRTLGRVCPEHHAICAAALDTMEAHVRKPCLITRTTAEACVRDTAKVAADITVTGDGRKAITIWVISWAVEAIIRPPTFVPGELAWAIRAAIRAEATIVEASFDDVRESWNEAIRRRWPEPPWSEAE